jgi:predicted amidophosphoribosyltransferase
VTSFAFARNHSVFAYAAEIKDLVRSYKFSGRVRLSRLFAQFLAEAIRNEFPTASVVPVPPRPGGSSLDPVGRMARMLRKEHGIPVLSPLVRTGGVSQKTLDLEERRKNLLGKIRVKPGFEAPQRTVLLDDIFTTGATADACARALCAAGCREVGVVTLAIEE